MAHFILEYSANLSGEPFEPRVLLGRLVSAVVDTGIFPEAGCRGRAHACEDFFVANGHADFAFVHLQVKLGAGRSDEDKQTAQDVLVETLDAYLKPISESRGLAISFEMAELPEHKANINNIREYLA